MTDITTFILAAGRSTRMKSSKSKIMHQVASRPMIEYVFELANQFGNTHTIVNPEMKISLEASYKDVSKFIIQSTQNGTGHAVKIAFDQTEVLSEWVLILYGDTPLLEKSHIDQMIKTASDKTAIVISTMHVNAPNQYGRVVSNGPEVRKIVEFKDASEEEKRLPLCNGGVMLLKTSLVKPWLNQLKPSPITGEYYLTDLVEMAVADGHRVRHCELPIDALTGVNNRSELAFVESKMQERLRETALLNGTTLIDPKSVFFSYDTKIGQDVLIEPNVFFGPNVVVENDVHIKAFSHIEGAHLSSHTKVGPFARLRPGAEIGTGSAVGNFVEIKNAKLHQGVKAGHLSYIGDAEIYDGVNIGAGTITCNYDGKNKHQTEIGSGAFIGSNTALVAPVKVGADALIAAGSVITKEVPEMMLAVARGRQKNLTRKK